MAGYLVTLSNVEALENCIKTGFYSTILRSPRYSSWMINHEGTFADYLSMKEGDLIFFFIQRKIYGCGRLVNVGSDCKYLNFKEADYPNNDTENQFASKHLLQYGSSENRCFCIFEPYPAFFRNGVDMDEVLQHKTCAFHSVRTLWKLSFIKMDDEESSELFNIILKHNEDKIDDADSKFEFDQIHHEILAMNNLNEYRLTRKGVIESCISGTRLGHEMALEAAMCELLQGEGVAPFGKWDYISHQVCASPFKPVDYMDKMDVFGYKFIPNYRVKSKYLIAELKKDEATIDVVEQILKYVDWVSDEYANGDYSMIEAYIVAAQFSDEVKESVRNHAIRNFNKGFRPTQFCVWSNLKLVQYSIDNNDVVFNVIDL